MAHARYGATRPGGGAARIVTVASDSRHTVRVWDWGGGHPGRPTPCVLTVAVGFAWTPPQVFGATWAPDADRFATFGVKHVKLWTAAEDEKLREFVSNHMDESVRNGDGEARG